MCKCTDAKLMTCAVCRLLDGDLSLKMCQFCSTCSAWICSTCMPDLVRRARAAAKKLVSGDGVKG